MEGEENRASKIAGAGSIYGPQGKGLFGFASSSGKSGSRIDLQRKPDLTLTQVSRLQES